MKKTPGIQEHELDGALNALFLETYSKKEDEHIAHFMLEQEYAVKVDSKKEAAVLARLSGKQGGNRNIFFGILGALLLIGLIIFFLAGGQKEKTISAPPPTGKAPGSAFTMKEMVKPAESKNSSSEINDVRTLKEITTVTNPSGDPDPYLPVVEPPPPSIPLKVNDSLQEKELPYFNKAGLAYFAKVKEQILQKIVKINDFLYARTEPGATMYKSREVLVSPFVMSNFPVTNQQYKAFLADLAAQGRTDEMKRCLPKQEVWKEYGCTILAKSYFENEAYNNFPVVNVSPEACMLYCEWLEQELNEKFEASSSSSKVKTSTAKQQKKQVIVRLPYDYEWIYSADAAYTLIPDCKGYNTIYDPSEGLVDKGFFKRTSQISKRDKRKETRMDQLLDVNRFGMTEAEMIAIFNEAMNDADGKSKGDPADPANYPGNIEACCLAGHVCELIKDRDEGMTVRGCCWKNKDEYLEMMKVYKKFGASPFVGFRVMILNTEKDKNRKPFW